LESDHALHSLRPCSTSRGGQDKRGLAGGRTAPAAASVSEEQLHRDNLRDIGRRYVDVSDLATVLAYFEEWRKSNA